MTNNKIEGKKFIPFKKQFHTIYSVFRHPNCPLFHKILFYTATIFTLIYIISPVDLLPGPIDDGLLTLVLYLVFKYEYDILHKEETQNT